MHPMQLEWRLSGIANAMCVALIITHSTATPCSAHPEATCKAQHEHSVHCICLLIYIVVKNDTISKAIFSPHKVTASDMFTFGPGDQSARH